MRTAAILPVKSFARAKQRLGASVADQLRLELAHAMVADVLAALAQTPAIERAIVVTRESSVAEAARADGALVVEDAAEDGQSAAVALGVRRALAEGMQRVLCVPGDCPALDPVELQSLLGGHWGHGGQAARRERVLGGGGAVMGEAEVVIVPDRHGTGTNGLLLTPADAIAASFGPDSCERHRALALAAGVACRTAQPPSLLLDIDTGADLAVLRDRLAGTHALASRTRAVLEEPERANVLSPVSAA